MSMRNLQVRVWSAKYDGLRAQDAEPYTLPLDVHRRETDSRDIAAGELADAIDNAFAQVCASLVKDLPVDYYPAKDERAGQLHAAITRYVLGE